MSPEFLEGLKNFGVDADTLGVIEPHSFEVDRRPYVKLKSSPSGALRLIGIAHARKLADYARRMGERALADRIEAAIPKHSEIDAEVRDHAPIWVLSLP